MGCTTLLAGRRATIDGSTYAARNEDAGGLSFDPKKMIVVLPGEQPKVYRSVLSGVEIPLPEEALRYTAMPNALPDEGIWGEAGVNALNISMTATETITTNSRVLGADPLVLPERNEKGEIVKPGGIGEEDMVTLVLPYIHSAREGVLRLGRLLEEYGTYEMNGIAFQDTEEVWWLESIGGHHWMAKRVPDDEYVVMPNQLGIDSFDLEDAYGEGKSHLCCPDLRDFIERNHLNPSLDGSLNPRDAFGSRSDADHVYNTPRAWFIQRYLSPHGSVYEGPEADLTPFSDDIPWSRKPERKISPEDVKYVLSAYYQGTPYDVYGHGEQAGRLRPIGINRNNFLSLVQYRRELPEEMQAVEWVAFGCNVFNAFVPLYANVDKIPEYFSSTGAEVTSENFYWANRIIAALCDGAFAQTKIFVERCQEKVPAEGRAILAKYDALFEEKRQRGVDVAGIREEANEEIAAMVKRHTQELLAQVLRESSLQMKIRFLRSDA